MVEVQQQPRSNSSVYGAQPRSLNIHWMKYDVSKENLEPNLMQAPKPAKLSPLRQRLQQSADQLI